MYIRAWVCVGVYVCVRVGTQDGAEKRAGRDGQLTDLTKSAEGEGSRYRLIAREIRLNRRCSRTAHRAWSCRRRKRKVNFKGPVGDGGGGGKRGGGIKRILTVRSADDGGVGRWVGIEGRVSNRPRYLPDNKTCEYARTRKMTKERVVGESVSRNATARRAEKKINLS
ncbi:hypothetical protein QTP88_007260 [Uroleucon formosanum]